MPINKKAQVAVLDLLIAITIFTVLITTVMLTWNKYNTKMEDQLEYNTMVIKAYHISDLLTQYPGKPDNWEKSPTENPLTIGLAYEEGIIDETKLDEFIRMEYGLSKEIINIVVYDYYFKLTKLDGSDFDPIIEKGILKDTLTVSTKRLVIYNGEEALLQFSLEK